MHMNLVGRLAATELEHCGPEQGVKRHDVFANEVVLLQVRQGHIGVKIFATLFQQVFKRRQITHRRIQPDVKIFAGCIRDLNAKVGRITADVPVAQTFALATVGVATNAEPLLDLVGDFGLQLTVLCPLLQKRNAARIRQFEEKVLRAFKHGRSARQS